MDKGGWALRFATWRVDHGWGQLLNRYPSWIGQWHSNALGDDRFTKAEEVADLPIAPTHVVSALRSGTLMKTKLIFWALCSFSLPLNPSDYLSACVFYPLEIQWLNLTNRVYLKPETIQYNFHILMNLPDQPFIVCLADTWFSFVLGWSAPLCGG